jgi:ABC-type sugar transport system ATPase subunit
VGDASFQRKCLDRMKQFRERGRTMVLISHDLPTIQATSDRILFLDAGRICGIGHPSRMVEEYQRFLRERDKAAQKRVWGTREVVITRVELLDEHGVAAAKFRRGRAMTARIHYKAVKRVEDPVFGFGISDVHGRVIYGNNTQVENFHVPAIEGEGVITLRLDRLETARGSYLLSLSVHSQDHLENYYRLENALPFEVECAENFEGCYMPCSWSV